jgi:hypothetical protein
MEMRVVLIKPATCRVAARVRGVAAIPLVCGLKTQMFGAI